MLSMSWVSRKKIKSYFHQMISVRVDLPDSGCDHGLSYLCLIVNTKPGWIQHVWKADLLSFFQA